MHRAFEYEVYQIHNLIHSIQPAILPAMTIWAHWTVTVGFQNACNVISHNSPNTDCFKILL